MCFSAALPAQLFSESFQCLHHSSICYKWYAQEEEIEYTFGIGSLFIITIVRYNDNNSVTICHF
jgi:hypothetical protein